MAAREVLVGFAVLALGAVTMASVAKAFPPCGYRACGDEVAASGLSGKTRGACLKQVIADCRAGLCSCTGGSPPCSCVCGDGLCGPSEDCATCPEDCGTCPPTTTTTTMRSLFLCTTTTIPLCGPGPIPHTCSSFGACPGGQTCQTDPSGCSCVGPAPACGDAGVFFCSTGTCPAGQGCQTVCGADGNLSCQCF
jgi:hypothetical protein